jgi:hypothetical protein
MLEHSKRGLKVLAINLLAWLLSVVLTVLLLLLLVLLLAKALDAITVTLCVS